MKWWKRFIQWLAKENKKVYKEEKPGCCSKETK